MRGNLKVKSIKEVYSEGDGATKDNLRKESGKGAYSEGDGAVKRVEHGAVEGGGGGAMLDGEAAVILGNVSQDGQGTQLCGVLQDTQTHK